MDTRRALFISLAAVLIAALAAVLVMTTVMIRRQSAQLSEVSDLVKNELADTSSTIADLQESLFLMTRDTGEIRQVLHMPEIEYPPLASTTEEPVEEIETNLVFFQSVDLLMEHAASVRNAAFFQTVIDDAALTSFLRRRGFSVIARNGTHASLGMGDDVYVDVEYLPDTGQFVLSDSAGDTVSVDTAEEIVRAAERMADQSESHLRTYRDAVDRLSGIDTVPGIAEVLKQQGIVLSSPVKEAGRTRIDLVYDQRPLISMGVEKDTISYFLGNSSYDSFETFAEELKEIIPALDRRTDIERQVDAMKQQLLDLHQDGGFLLFLENNGLTLSRQFREDSDYYYLDVQNADGTRIGAFAVQKLVGEIYLTDWEDIPLSSLRTLGHAPAAGDEKKN